ncbi:MAG: hypothetical protein ACRDKZ_12490 [Actinomycetota bacterium]
MGGALLISGLVGAPAAVADHDAINDCPTIKPVSELARGMVGTGYTVSEGTEPEAFSVEVLGVLPDGVAPGRDMIMVEAFSPAIDEAGIWAGMSGSPVFVGGELIGAVAFGLNVPDNVAGVTPAEDMLDVLNKPTTASTQLPRKARLSRSWRQRIAREARISTSEVGGSVTRLRIPLSVSGLGTRAGFGEVLTDPELGRIDLIKKIMRRERLGFQPYAGAAVAAPTDISSVPLEAGGNFAAAMSYGDVSFAGVGTTTMVCDGRAVAFGHPFAFQGDTTMGANHADALGILTGAFDSFKLATVEEAVGTVDQDRLAAIRALTGDLPDLIPIRSVTTALSGQGVRLGESDAVVQEIVPSLAFSHLFSNIDSVYDEIGEGSSELSWTVQGTRASGGTWTLDRSNMYADDFDISFGSVFEIADQLFVLLNNAFEDVEFTGIDTTINVEPEVKRLSITNVLVSTDGENFKDVRRLRVRRGQTVTLRVELEPSGAGELETVDLEVRIPRKAGRNGAIELGGGQNFADPLFCLIEGSGCERRIRKDMESFEDFLAFLEGQPSNNEVVAQLRGGRRFSVQASDSETLDRVVSGRQSISLRIRR